MSEMHPVLATVINLGRVFISAGLLWAAASSGWPFWAGILAGVVIGVLCAPVTLLRAVWRVWFSRPEPLPPEIKQLLAEHREFMLREDIDGKGKNERRYH